MHKDYITVMMIIGAAENTTDYAVYKMSELQYNRVMGIIRDLLRWNWIDNRFHGYELTNLGIEMYGKAYKPAK